MTRIAIAFAQLAGVALVLIALWLVDSRLSLAAAGLALLAVGLAAESHRS